MTYVEFEQAIRKPEKHQRLGQSAFNLLYRVRPDLSEQIRGEAYIDPFYSNGNMGAFLTWLRENWDK